MKHGTQCSTVKPQSVEVYETKVFVSDNIRPVSTDIFTGYEFDLTEYTKDEYIKQQSVERAALEITISGVAAAFAYLPLEIQAAMVENQTNQLLSQEDLL